MATYTGGSWVDGPSETQSSTNLVQVAYDRMAYFSLRPELYFDQVADVRATNQAMPGKSVIFTIVNDLQIAPNALSESTDVTPVSFSDSQVTVTLNEYGNSMVTSAKLRGTAFVDIDPVVANVIGYNAGVSLDTIARSVLDSGTQVAYGGSATARNAVATTDVITSNNIRTARARLRAANVPTFGGAYVGFIHPDVVVDLQNESNSNPLLTWRAPHTYSAPNEIWTGDLGQYEGVRWIETPRAPVFTGAGASSSTNVYGTIIVGRQSLAKAHAMADGNGPLPTIVEGPVTDLLRRYVPLGWYWLGGYSIFRQASVYRLETGSALNADVGASTGTYNVTSGSLSGTFTGTPPGLGSLLTAGTATFSSGAGNAVVSSVNVGAGTFTFAIGNGGTVTGSGTVTVSSSPVGYATLINPTIDLGETGSPLA